MYRCIRPCVSYFTLRYLVAEPLPAVGLNLQESRPEVRDDRSRSTAWRTAPYDLEFCEAPRLDRLKKIESGPLWRGPVNLAMSDHVFRR